MMWGWVQHVCFVRRDPLASCTYGGRLLDLLVLSRSFFARYLYSYDLLMDC